MHLETAREAIHAKKPTPIDTLRATAQAGKSTPIEKSRENKKCKNGDRHQSLESNNKKAKSSNQRVLKPSLSKYTTFTDLTGSIKEVILATEQIGIYKRPDLL